MNVFLCANIFMCISELPKRVIIAMAQKGVKANIHLLDLPHCLPSRWNEYNLWLARRLDFNSFTDCIRWQAHINCGVKDILSHHDLKLSNKKDWEKSLYLHVFYN